MYYNLQSIFHFHNRFLIHNIVAADDEILDLLHLLRRYLLLIVFEFKENHSLNIKATTLKSFSCEVLALYKICTYYFGRRKITLISYSYVLF